MPILGKFEEVALLVATNIEEWLDENDEYLDLLYDLAAEDHPEFAADDQELTLEEQLEQDAQMDKAITEVENRILDRAIRAVKNPEDPLWHKGDRPR